MTNTAEAIGSFSHNDSEAGVANAMIAVDLDIEHVQGTINRFGERCGNANLTSILPALIYKMGMDCQARDHIDQLYTTSRLVNEMANQLHNRYHPYVGESAFAHKGGIHKKKGGPVTAAPFLCKVATGPYEKLNSGESQVRSALLRKCITDCSRQINKFRARR